MDFVGEGNERWYWMNKRSTTGDSQTISKSNNKQRGSGFAFEIVPPQDRT